MFDDNFAVERVEELANSFVASLPNLLLGVIVFAFFYVIGRIVNAVVERIVRRREKAEGIAVVMGRLAQWVIVLLGFFVSLTAALPSLEPGQLVELLGISSVAIGFAFRDVLQNFLAGILLIFTQPFWIGDQIIFGEYEGTVEDIQTRATYIKTYDGRRIIVPNAELFTKSVIINTAYRTVRTEYTLGIGYGDDLTRAQELIYQAVTEVPEVMREPVPTVWVTELAESTVNISVWWWTESFRYDVVVVRSKVLTRIKELLTEQGIDLPFPTSQVLFHDQTEATDGDRARQREGWPAGPETPPGQRGIASALERLRPDAGN
jgi:small-conductance mechanosensitive channel